MKATTFEKRIGKVTKNSNGYRNAIEAMTTGNKVYTCHTSGSGRFTTNIDSTEATINIIRAAGLVKGIDFIYDNDSPRGGKTGNYVQVTNKNKLIKN